MNKVCAYNEEQCKKIVEPYIPFIKNKFGKEWCIFDYRKIYTFDEEIHKFDTPRQSLISSFVPCASFYYINFLLKKTPSCIIDLGCGINFYKEIIPNIVGVDPASEYADIIDMFDNEYLINHKNNYEAIISIDALHFIPISNFVKRVQQFYDLLLPGGRGYLSMNVARMLGHDSLITTSIFNTSNPDPISVENYIIKELKNLNNIHFLVKDIFISEKFDDPIDGNIRLVMEKKK